jgi:hypothetical protein
MSYGNSISRYEKGNLPSPIQTELSHGETNHYPISNGDRVPEQTISNGLVLVTVFSLTVLIREIRLLVIACKS